MHELTQHDKMYLVNKDDISPNMCGCFIRH
jgi:hypothetical protein